MIYAKNCEKLSKFVEVTAKYYRTRCILSALRENVMKLTAEPAYIIDRGFWFAGWQRSAMGHGAIFGAWRTSRVKNLKLLPGCEHWPTLNNWLKTFYETIAFNPLIATLKPQSNRPSYSNTVIGTLAVDGWAVIFGTARRGLGGVRPGLSSLYWLLQPTHQRPVYQLRIIRCAIIGLIAFGV